MGDLNQGTPATREFYEREGWHERDGKLEDTQLFGVREDGPIRKALHEQRTRRILDLLREAGDSLNFLELGCGGNPELNLRLLWGHYTGVDFSAQGLAVSQTKLGDVPHRLVEADITRLPLEDGAYDAVYSANALYHIDRVEGQSAALSEAMRVLRPGGVGVFVLANPYPLLFPVRLAKRLVAVTPVLGPLANRLRPPPPLPYLPLRPGWFRSQLQRHGRVTILTYAMASTWFNQHVSEFGFVGRQLWRLIALLETRCPRLAMRLGNYTLVQVVKA